MGIERVFREVSSPLRTLALSAPWRDVGREAPVNWLAPLSIAQTAALAFLGFCVLDLAAKVENREQIAVQRVNDVTSPGAIAQAYFPAETVSAADIRSIVREEFAALSTAPENGAPSRSRMAAAQPPANPSFQGQVRQQLKTHISRGRMSTISSQ